MIYVNFAQLALSSTFINYNIIQIQKKVLTKERKGGIL